MKLWAESKADNGIVFTCVNEWIPTEVVFVSMKWHAFIVSCKR